MLYGYVGNGVTDKLVGVDGEEQSISADDKIRHDDFELIGEEDDDDI